MGVETVAPNLHGDAVGSLIRVGSCNKTPPVMQAYPFFFVFNFFTTSDISTPLPRFGLVHLETRPSCKHIVFFFLIFNFFTTSDVLHAWPSRCGQMNTVSHRRICHDTTFIRPHFFQIRDAGTIEIIRMLTIIYFSFSSLLHARIYTFLTLEWGGNTSYFRLNSRLPRIISS